MADITVTWSAISAAISRSGARKTAGPIANLSVATSETWLPAMMIADSRYPRLASTMG